MHPLDLLHFAALICIDSVYLCSMATAEAPTAGHLLLRHDSIISHLEATGSWTRDRQAGGAYSDVPQTLKNTVTGILKPIVFRLQFPQSRGD